MIERIIHWLNKLDSIELTELVIYIVIVLPLVIYLILN